MKKVLLLVSLALTAPFAVPAIAQSESDEKPAGIQAPKLDYTPYLKTIQPSVKRAWFPPLGTQTMMVLTTFRIHRDGEMSHLQVEHSSGKTKVDTAAVIAVENAAPFPHLPEGSPESIRVRFTFVEGGCKAKFLPDVEKKPQSD